MFPFFIDGVNFVAYTIFRLLGTDLKILRLDQGLEVRIISAGSLGKKQD